MNNWHINVSLSKRHYQKKKQGILFVTKLSLSSYLREWSNLYTGRRGLQRGERGTERTGNRSWEGGKVFASVKKRTGKDQDGEGYRIIQRNKWLFCSYTLYEKTCRQEAGHAHVHIHTYIHVYIWKDGTYVCTHVYFWVRQSLSFLVQLFAFLNPEHQTSYKEDPRSKPKERKGSSPAREGFPLEALRRNLCCSSGMRNPLYNYP